MSNKGGNKLLGLKREHREADEVRMIILIKYREESEGETENPKKDQEKTDLTKSIQSTPTIKKIKINVRDKKSSASIKSSTLESEIIQNVPFSVNEEPIQKVEEKIPQEKENQTNEHNENEEVKLNKNGKKEEKPTSFLFSNNNGSSLFSGSLFSNNANKNSLFGSSSGSSLSNLFSNLNKTEGGSLFNFSNLSNGGSTFFNKKNESDEEGSDGEKDNENEKRSDSPEVYRPTTEKSTGPYTKKYVKLVESFFVYNKKDKKYLSKGDGYFSIEYSEEPKKSAVFVFRYLK